MKDSQKCKTHMYDMEVKVLHNMFQIVGAHVGKVG